MATYEADVIKSRIAEAKADWGLQMRMDYLENLDNGIYTVQSGGFYKRRGFMEFRWNVLSGGLSESKQEAKKLSKKLELYRLKQERKQEGSVYSQLFNRIIYTFNKAKLTHLQHKQELLKQKQAVDRKRFSNDQILYDKVINTKSKVREAKQMKANIRNYNQNVTPDYPSRVQPENLPVLDIMLDTVLKDIRKEDWIDTMLSLQEQIHKYDNAPTKDIRLSPYLRHNVYNNPDGYTTAEGVDQGNLRQFFSWGVSLSLPIKFDDAPDRALRKAKLARAKAKAESETKVDIKEALNTYYEYQYALNQYIEFHHKKARIVEKARQEQAKYRLKDDSYNPVRLLGYAISIASVNFELADIQQKMYLKLLNLDEYLTDRSIKDVVKQHPIRNQVRRLHAERSIYIWSDAFQNFPNARLIQALNNHNIKGAHISLGPENQARAKAERFIEQGKKQGIKVSLLIGDNQLFKPENYNRLEALVNEGEQLGVKALHLDVEPHTLRGWEENRENYLDQYQSMVAKAHDLTQGKGLELAVSVPIWYQPGFYKKLYSNCDQVFIMAYKREDILQLKKTLTTEIPLEKQKTTVALRPEDFGSLPKFYQFAGNVKEATGIHQFALHDLEVFMGMNNSK